MAWTPEEQLIAQWMAEECQNRPYVYQQQVVAEIQRRFGNQHIHSNKSGNPAINKGILDAFNDLTKEDVVWSTRLKYWRKRAPADPPGARKVLL